LNPQPISRMVQEHYLAADFIPNPVDTREHLPHLGIVVLIFPVENVQNVEDRELYLPLLQVLNQELQVRRIV
jgi:hypothetical protein